MRAIALTSRSEILLIKELRTMMLGVKKRLRIELPKIYSQDLLNNLFRYPYTKIEFVQKDLGVSRPTAARYLDLLAKHKFVRKRRIGRTNFFINDPLYTLLTTITLPGE